MHRESEAPVTTDPHSPLTATQHSPLTTDCRSKLSRPLALIVARRPDYSSTFVVSALTITGHHHRICAHCRRSTKLSLLSPLHLTLVVSVPTVAARLASSFSLLTIVEKVYGCIAGGVAGVVVETALYPIDTIKTQLQVNLIYDYHPIPIVFSQAKGVAVWDPEGNKYLDFLSAYSAVNQVEGESFWLRSSKKILSKR
ncbi:hypothetical protein Ahy_B01g054443 [Arachis hypogaea]|uniref:Uncharacterized protein n=1 Tax=Arachis hypogaea TaxID=3818 RepID=A0A445ATZ3_ARAHY|nr:hypothetical protein Ahy_B01g054443 [Arachis hypogaea]